MSHVPLRPVATRKSKLTARRLVITFVPTTSRIGLLVARTRMNPSVIQLGLGHLTKGLGSLGWSWVRMISHRPTGRRGQLPVKLAAFVQQFVYRPDRRQDSVLLAAHPANGTREALLPLSRFHDSRKGGSSEWLVNQCQWAA